MPWYQYKKFSLAHNLAPVSHRLRQLGIDHRFTEEGGDQVLWLAGHCDHGYLDELIAECLDSEPLNRQADTRANKTMTSGREAYRAHSKRATSVFYVEALMPLLRQFPVTMIVIILGLCGYLCYVFKPLNPVLDGLVYWPLSLQIESMQVWRMVTPAFIHFGLLHIVFNGLWVWLMGRMLEQYLGAWRYLLLFVLTAIASNVLQFYMSQSINFGGLSGVVYGFMGFLLVARFFHRRQLFLPEGIFIFSLVMLGLGYTGAFEFVLGVGVANSAHLGGLLSGIACALVYFPLLDKRRVLKSF